MQCRLLRLYVGSLPVHYRIGLRISPAIWPSLNMIGLCFVSINTISKETSSSKIMCFSYNVIVLKKRSDSIKIKLPPVSDSGYISWLYESWWLLYSYIFHGTEISTSGLWLVDILQSHAFIWTRSNTSSWQYYKAIL